MRFTRPLRAVGLACLAGFAGVMHPALAQEYPSKPITLLVGFAAG